LETYARNVGLEIEKLGLEGVIVRESPVKRSFGKLLKKYDASWVFDLHSDVTEPYWIKKDGKWISALPRKRGRFSLSHGEPPDYSDVLQKPFPIARLEYGGKVWDPDAEFREFVRNETGQILAEFLEEKYGGLYTALVLDAFWPMQCHERLLGFGLVYARPLDVTVDLVKSLAEYLYERS